MSSPQYYANRIEKIMCKAFDRKSFDASDFVSSDYIRSHPFTAMMSTLTYLCEYKDDDSLNAVFDFFETYHYCSKRNIDELLNSSSKAIDDMTCEIELSNDEEAMKEIIDAFSELCQKLQRQLDFQDAFVE